MRTDDPVILRRGAKGLGGLDHGELECVVSPSQGGSIAGLTWFGPAGAVPLLRRTGTEALTSGTAADLACFPLVPFSNRVAAGRFRFDGRDVTLPLNQPYSPHAIHGHAWEASWRVEEQTATAVRLSYRHEAGAWPWSYRAIQTIALEEDGLTVVLDLVNEDRTTMPAGIGLHPYISKPPGTTLTARLDSVWLNDPTLLPARRAALPACWAFPKGVVMDRTVLDNGFTGWDGQAAVTWPSLDLRLSIIADGPFDHLVIYAPEGGDYLCVEPVTHMTDALNHPEEPDCGLHPLLPGERLSGVVRFQVETI